jgi:hypothetical protein
MEPYANHTTTDTSSNARRDCGLACALMALEAVGVRGHSLASLRALCPTSSIWTIHLAHLLRQCGVHAVMCTTTPGARADYLAHKYYARTSPADLAAIDRLFQDAPAAGIALHQCSVPLERLQHLMLEGRWLAIVLVDGAQLGASGPAAARPTALPPRGGEPLSGGAAAARRRHQAMSYSGHYLVLCGYDCSSGTFEVRDPATEEGQQLRLSSERLEVARRAYGTDEDLLLVALPPAARQPGCDVRYF